MEKKEYLTEENYKIGKKIILFNSLKKKNIIS